MTDKKADFKSIWETLSKVDVTPKIQKKGKLAYLSWAWAWGTLMEHYPQAGYCFAETEYCGVNNTATVHVAVTIDSCTREMWLPVMDHRNNAISEPDARQISDAKMRCIVKCLAMFGLGHHIYAGEDIPTDSPQAAVKTNSQSVEMARAFLAGEAVHGIGHLHQVWSAYPEPIRTTILKDHKVWWDEAKDTAKAADAGLLK